MKKNYIVPILFSVLTFILLIALLSPTFLFIGSYIKNLPEKPKESHPPTETVSSPTPEEPSQSISPSVSEPQSSTEGTPSPSLPVTPTPTPTPSLSKEPEDETPWILKASEDAGDAYQNNLTFLGDSTTYGLLDRAILQNGQQSNRVWFGVNGHTITFKFHQTIAVSNKYGASEGMLIKELAAQEKPEILVITIGVTGGVSYSMEQKAFTDLYNALIDDVLSASPQTKVICNTIYPVCKQIREDYGKYIDNEKIRNANNWIKELVGKRYLEGDSVYFLDSYSLLADADGYLPAALSNGDGLHLSDEGLRKVLEILRTHKIPD